MSTEMQIGAADTLTKLAAFREIVHGRKSVRAYLPEPLSEGEICQLLELASWSPSNCNTQPWRVHVVSGETLVRLREELLADSLANGVSPDIPYNAKLYPPDLLSRMANHLNVQQLAFGICREDEAARNKMRANNHSFFGAPHVLLLYLPAFANEREAADLGMFAQTFMLALAAAGFAGVPQTSVGVYAAPVRRILQPTHDDKLMFAISFGREDPDASAGRLVQERCPVESFAVFHK